MHGLFLRKSTGYGNVPGFFGRFMDLIFFLNAALLGAGLAMDAFSVSAANGLNEPNMPRRKMILIAAVFGLFQTVMPLIGWVCVTTVVELFKSFEKFIPWIALILLLYIGIKMLIDGFRKNEDEKPSVGIGALLIQGIATSIDALSVGFTIAGLSLTEAVIEAAIIGIITFGICIIGLIIGKKFGTILSGKASVLGGTILIIIGIEIFIKGVI